MLLRLQAVVVILVIPCQNENLFELRSLMEEEFLVSPIPGFVCRASDVSHEGQILAYGFDDSLPQHCGRGVRVSVKHLHVQVRGDLHSQGSGSTLV